MTDDAGSTADPHATGADDDDLPIYQPPFGLDAVPGFCDRLVQRLLAGGNDEEFVFEGVEVEEAQGVWMAPLGGYVPDAVETPADAPVDPTLPPGGYAEVAAVWTEGVRRVIREAWGEPLVRTPRRAGSEQEPEGILDYLLLTLGIPEAEMWDRGELCCVLLTSWDGQERASSLRQILVVLPRAMALGGFSAIVQPEDTVHELLMHGEHPTELRRRAWIMSTLYGAGETRVRDTAIPATRCSLQARDGTTTVWTFADDGRILVVLHDPSCEFARSAPQQLLDDLAADAGDGEGEGEAGAADVANDADGQDAHGEAAEDEREEALADATMILVARMLSGVPEDLHELMTARADRADGAPAAHDLAFRPVGDRVLPVLSGVAWFDGDDWHVPAPLTEIGRQNGFGMDDFGFGSAVRRPYRLGGAFSVDHLLPTDDERYASFERVIAACPYPEQERPGEAARLAYGVPASADHADLVAQVERASDAWWERTPSDAAWNDDTFRIGGSDLDEVGERLLATTIAIAERWNLDALQRWTDGLSDAMTARWGTPLSMDAYDERLRADRRTPLARYLRITGLGPAPMWWVDGHAVLLLSGIPDRDFGDGPQVVVVVSRPDAVLDLMRGLDPWEVRHRFRLVGEVAAVATTESTPRVAAQAMTWDGPALKGSTIVPDAVRGRLRAGDWSWVWHVTHVTDGPRALLLGSRLDDERSAGASFDEGSADVPFDDVAARFAGLPAELLSLVVDRESDGLYPVARRDVVPDADDLVGGARSLPAVDVVFWLDGLHWRASDDLLRRARAVVVAEAAGTGISTASPLESLFGVGVGVPQLTWVLRTGEPLGVPALASAAYASAVLDRPLEAGEAEDVVRRLRGVHARALTGSLADVLDVVGELDGARELRTVLDLALSNPNARRRREIALWLLSKPVDASIPLSFLTPINVLFENPTLGADDAVVVLRLLARGAHAGAGLPGATIGGHPIVQLARRDLDESELLPLVDVLLDLGEAQALEWPDGDLLAEVAGAEATHGRSRQRLLEMLRSAQEGMAPDPQQDAGGLSLR